MKLTWAVIALLNGMFYMVGVYNDNTVGMFISLAVIIYAMAMLAKAELND